MSTMQDWNQHLTVNIVPNSVSIFRMAIQMDFDWIAATFGLMNIGVNIIDAV